MPASDTTEASGSSVVFLSGDLIFASRIRAAAESAGLRFQLSGNLPAVEQSRPAVSESSPPAPEIKFVIVDLSTRSSVVETLMEQVSSRCPEASVIAYAPHVQVDRIKTARQAGIPTVLTRGQFDAALSGMFQPKPS